LDRLARQRRGAAPAIKTADGPTPTSAGPPDKHSEPRGLGDILSTWVIAPLIFLFLLVDTGSPKARLLRSRSESALRARPHRARRRGPGVRELRTRHLPRVLRARGDGH